MLGRSDEIFCGADLVSVKDYYFSGWSRVGIKYRHSISDLNGGVCVRELGFITYHLIKLIHGQDKLDAMSRKLPEHWINNEKN